MKNSFYTILFLALPSLLIGQLLEANNKWQHHYSGTEHIFVQDLATDVNGNIYSLGHFRGTADIKGTSLTSTEQQEVYLSKMDSSGAISWAKHFDAGKFSINAVDVEIDPSGNPNVLITFADSLDVDPGAAQVFEISDNRTQTVVIKLNSNGDYLTHYRLEGTSELTGQKLDFAPDGSLLIGGIFRDTVDFDPGIGEVKRVNSQGLDAVFVLKLSSSGIFDWVKTFHGNSNKHLTGLASDDQGNIVICGKFAGTIDIDPSTIPVDTIIYNSRGQYDLFVAKFTPAGIRTWSHHFGTHQNEGCVGLEHDKNYNILLAVNFFDSINLNPGPAKTFVKTNGSQDVALLQLKKDGTFGWVKTFGGTDKEEALRLHCNGNGSVVVGGYFRSDTLNVDTVTLVKPDNKDNGFMIGYTSSGELDWTKALLSDESLYVRGLTSVPSGQIIAGGNFFGNTKLGSVNTTITSAGKSDGYILSVLPGIPGVPIDTNTKDTTTTIALLEDAENALIAYPNPTKNIVHIKGLNILKISIINSSGSVIQLIDDYSQNEVDIDLTEVPQGVYFLQVRTHEKLEFRKILKQ